MSPGGRGADRCSRQNSLPSGSIRTSSPLSPRSPMSVRRPPSCEEPTELSGGIFGAQVHVASELGGLGRRSGLQPHRRLAASGRVEHGAAVLTELHLVAQRRGPERRHHGHVLDVEGDLGDPARHEPTVPTECSAHTPVERFGCSPRRWSETGRQRRHGEAQPIPGPAGDRVSVRHGTPCGLCQAVLAGRLPATPSRGAMSWWASRARTTRRAGRRCCSWRRLTTIHHRRRRDAAARSATSSLLRR